MKKVLAALLFAALVIPAMANVTISASDNDNEQLAITFTTTDASVVRGIALTLTVTGGDVASFISSDFNTFVDYAFTTGATYEIGMTGQHPFALESDPGVATTPIAAGTAFAVSVGYLDQLGAQAGCPGSSVALIQLDIPNGTTAIVAISANAARGGAVVGDELGTIEVQASQTVEGDPEEHTVSTPNVPTGTTPNYITLANTVTTGGSVDSQGHGVQYRFDWGDGTTTAWSTATSVTKTFTVGGTYSVKAQARCASDLVTESAWSEGFSLVIQQCQFYNLTKKVTTFNPTGTDNVVNSADVSKIVSYINSYKVSSSVWAVVITNPNYNAQFNLSTVQSPINSSDVSALVTYINNNKLSSSVWVVNCTSKP